MNKISENIEATLNSLEGIQRATPGPFFFTRLNARLLNNQKTGWETIGRLLSRPVVAVSGLCFIILINTLVVIKQSTRTSSTADTVELASVDEYTIAASNFYDFENTELK